MELYKRNGIYQVTFQSSGGCQTRRSLKTRDKGIAKQRAAKLELDIHEATLFGKEPARSFKKLMVAYLEAKTRNRGFARLQYAAKPLLNYFGDSDLSKIKESHVEKYIAWRSKSVSDGTVLREVGMLSAAFNHAIRKHHWRIENPCKGADKPKEPKGRVRFITRAEAQRLIHDARWPLNPSGKALTDQHRSPALADFIELALNTGCRKSELLALKWDHVDFATRLLYLAQTKGGEWQTVPITEEARQLLVKRMRLRDQVCPDSPYVFFHEIVKAGAEIGDIVGGLKKSFASACIQAGIKDFRIHDLRHTFASWLVMDGVPLYEVSKMLRHSSIKMTERYAHLAPDHLHQVVANRGFSARFQHTENPLAAVVSKNG
ncbi:MAG: site-specific integrase [Acidiferrobacteraceae bacterium]|nr:site-specific integrase [Acidiferrobacteraceae bacterium]